MSQSRARPVGSAPGPLRVLSFVPFVTVAILAAFAFGDEANSAVNEGWKTRFHEVYRLEKGETVKFIPAPFIPERGEYAGGAAAGRFRTTGQYILLWDDTKQGEDRLARGVGEAADGKGAPKEGL